CSQGVVCCVFSVIIGGVKIIQPQFMFSRVGDKSVTLQCEQDNNEYLYMLWYRHADTGQMQLLTYSVNKGIEATEAPFSEAKYSMSRPEVCNSTLHIKQVEAGDSVGFGSYGNLKIGCSSAA
uniref:Immunoglobulin V-set domain-containing protein n=1 Tax=Amphilophus citrinellus TaxID=61819 RepID=A0A3Q0T463_AMPCI